MRVYANRLDLKYQQFLRQVLEIDGSQGLEATALDIGAPIRAGKRRYDQAICLDYLGLCATTLFDRGQISTPAPVFDQLQQLAHRTERLNAMGILVRLRVLLNYPFSAAAQARVEAESSFVRASISEPKFHRGSRLPDIIREDTFRASALLATMDRVVSVIEDWRHELGPKHAFFSHPNRCDVRFSCINPMVCGLRVNRHFFYDPYTFAKADRYARCCANNVAPLIALNADDLPDLSAYKAFCDHFRFLWDHAATADYGDVVHRVAGMTRLRPPEEVTYALTARRVLSFEGKAHRQDALREYQRGAQRIMRRFCAPLKPMQTREVVFIATSWHGNPPRPGAEAVTLQRLLRRDFGFVENGVSRGGGRCALETKLVQARAGAQLSDTIYKALDEATVGLVVLSPEIKHGSTRKVRFTAKENVYLELGYLMGRLPGRVVVFRESSVEPPSNIANLVHIEYRHDQIDVKYVELLCALRDLGFFKSTAAFDRVARGHMVHLSKLVELGRIKSRDVEWALKRLKGGDDTIYASTLSAGARTSSMSPR